MASGKLIGIIVGALVVLAGTAGVILHPATSPLSSIHDEDGDGYADADDAFPNDDTQTHDADGDGYGDDPSGNQPDIYPKDPSQWFDTDGDEFGDNPDGTRGDMCPDQAGTISNAADRGCPDFDRDNVADRSDAFPNDNSQWLDRDGDGYGDSVSGTSPDAFPDNPSQWLDSDGDGYGDNQSADATQVDALPQDATQWSDEDGDGWGDNASGNLADDCPTEEGYSTTDRLGCPDADSDAMSDENDPFDDDNTQWADEDGDNFGDNPTGNDADQCPQLYGTLTVPEHRGCPDMDGDGIADRVDSHPNIGNQWNDRDGDGWGDNPSGVAPDAFGDNPTQWKDSDGDFYGDNPESGQLTVANQWRAGDFQVTEWSIELGSMPGDLRIHALYEDGFDGHLYVYSISFNPNDPTTNLIASNDDYMDIKQSFLQVTADDAAIIIVVSGYNAGDEGSFTLLVMELSGDDTHPAARTWVYQNNTRAQTMWTPPEAVDGVFIPFNATQADAFRGDSTQWRDQDGDGYGDNPAGNYADDCPTIPGSSSEDRFGCEDNDGDGWSDQGDVFPQDGTQWSDQDGDGYGDNQWGNDGDACPTQYGDSTEDRLGCLDSDGDGYSDSGDAFPGDPNEWRDSDGDGTGDNADFYDFGDGAIRISITYFKADTGDSHDFGGGAPDPFFQILIDYDKDGTTDVTRTSSTFNNAWELTNPYYTDYNTADSRTSLWITIRVYDSDATSNDQMDYTSSSAGMAYRYTVYPNNLPSTHSEDGRFDGASDQQDCELDITFSVVGA